MTLFPGGPKLKLIIPMAGKDEKLKPHTHTTPKALLHVAGKTLLQHVLDSVSNLNVDTAIFIVDQHHPELEKEITKRRPFKSIFIMQKERKGVGHAVFGAKKYVGIDDVVIIFADTLIETDINVIKKHMDDGIIWTKQVKDPRQYGVTFLHNNYVSKLIEKPDTPVSDKAMVGMYYFKHSVSLFKALEYLITNEILTKGEYQLTDAIQLMINDGAKFVSQNVKTWHDCGTAPNLLNTNKYLLKKQGSKASATKDSVIIKPVFIEKGADVMNSVIGPNVSIGKDAIIKNSVISNSILNNDCHIDTAVLKDCIIGKQTSVRGNSKKLNIGDSSEVHYS